jgi:hypothetical protein
MVRWGQVRRVSWAWNSARPTTSSGGYRCAWLTAGLRAGPLTPVRRRRTWPGPCTPSASTAALLAHPDLGDR